MGKAKALKKIAASICAIAFLMGCGNGDYTSVSIENKDAVVSGIRQAMVNRAYSTVVTVRAYTDDEDGVVNEIEGLMPEVFSDNDNPRQGDYLKYQYGGYEIKSAVSTDRGKYTYKIRIIPRYYTTAEEEKEVDEMVAEALDSMMLSESATDYEKVRAVNDYICDLVEYDTVHKHTPGSGHIQSTAYGCLKYHTALCQGYAVLCHRLLKELSVDTRVVTGDLNVDGIREKHAWNIVYVEGCYYNLDVTLNDVNETDDFFLAGSDEFNKNHFPSAEFLNDDFTSRYQISKENYIN